MAKSMCAEEVTVIRPGKDGLPDVHSYLYCVLARDHAGLHYTFLGDAW